MAKTVDWFKAYQAHLHNVHEELYPICVKRIWDYMKEAKRKGKVCWNKEVMIYWSTKAQKRILPIIRRISHAMLGVLVVLMVSCSFEENSSAPSSSGSAPAAPTEMTTTMGNNQVTLNWKEVAGVSSYNLYCRTPRCLPDDGEKNSQRH